jgi:hypothetical protein
MNIFEQILVEPETARLISLVWSTFKLWQNGFVLNLVNKLLKLCSQIDFLFYKTSNYSEIHLENG